MTGGRYARQDFLGDDAQDRIERSAVAIVGLGGGGSHVVQQLAHIGFRRYVLYDPDSVEDTNLNRLVMATEADAEEATPKIEVARRVIGGLHRAATVEMYRGRWQDTPGPMRCSDLIIGCVDGFAERRELEICARRFLIPYIDIGMDVHRVDGEPPRIGGQVILSMPGGPCMTCIGFLNEERLAREAAAYGSAGPRPQVIWPNGVLASTAVGIAVDLVTGWTRSERRLVYLSYSGNDGTMVPHPRLPYVGHLDCPHFHPEDVGNPVLRAV